MADHFYGTEGGGFAVRVGNTDTYVWHEPPEKFPAMKGDLVPSEWGVTGPFDENGKPITEDIYEHEF